MIDETDLLLHAQRQVILFSVMSVCGCVCCQHARYLLNRLRYDYEIFTGARYDQKLARLRKWLHFDALHE